MQILGQKRLACNVIIFIGTINDIYRKGNVRSVLAVHKVTSRLRDEERDNGRHPGRLAADHTSAPSIHVRST
jgi:hypothetical protein